MRAWRLPWLAATKAKRNTPTLFHYCTSKGGLESLVQCLALDLGPRGVRVYDVDFVLVGKTKYEYEIDAVTGEIREESIETVRTAAPKTGNTGAKTGAPAGSGQKEAFNAPISLEEAKAIALERAGKRADEVTFGKAKLERDDGVWSYEIEFFVPGVMEYEYEIDAETGAVLEEDVERWDD